MFERPDRPSAQDVQDVIQYLQGSCSSFNQEEWEIQELDQIFDVIYECQRCNWWEEVGYGDGDVCEQCEEEQKEE